MVTRPVQLSAFPEIQPAKPVGAIVGSVLSGSNGDLIKAVAPLYFAGRSVLDVTYGEGAWWTRYRPEDFTCHDLDPTKGDGVDFRCLPEPDGSVDVVCFDPPYLPQGGYETSTVRKFADAYGLAPRSRSELRELHRAGLAECARVARQLVVVKANDFVNGGGFRLGHLEMIKSAEAVGLKVHDLIIHHTGSGPGGHTTFKVLRARRHHSYLIVFTPPPRRRAP